jgi:hypothetical protein
VNLAVNVDGEDLTPWSEMVAVPYAFRAEYVNRFPAPHYDSGWTNIVTGCQNINHSLGGNPDNYIVDMQLKDLNSGFSFGVHQWAYGQYTDDMYGTYGVSWSRLDATKVRICRGTDDIYANQVRIRIWRTD